MTSGQVVGYIRVSSDDQNEARQLDGQNLDVTFTDKASGKNADRPKLQAMITHVRAGDTVMVHSMDRLARSVIDLRKIVDELVNKGVHVHFVKENLKFKKPSSEEKGSDDLMADLMLSVMGAIAEFERGIIGERQREGINLAKKLTGKDKVYLGRKHSLSAVQAADLKKRADTGEPKAGLAREFGISRAALYVYLGRDAA
jgi:DNA invertase Pin-like site-specific DNA recombinase